MTKPTVISVKPDDEEIEIDGPCRIRGCWDRKRGKVVFKIVAEEEVKASRVESGQPKGGDCHA